MIFIVIFIFFASYLGIFPCYHMNIPMSYGILPHDHSQTNNEGTLLPYSFS